MRYPLALTCLLLLMAEIWGHGMMLDPPSRSSRWRFDATAPHNWNDNELFCGGLYTQIRQGGRCGLCGDNFALTPPRPNEIGGQFGGVGIISQFYATANTISVRIKITTNHLGHFEFQLCNLDAFGAETEACFSQNRLLFADGNNKLEIGTLTGEFDVLVLLPKGLICKHCVLRWTYVGANNWGICDNGIGALGCGPQETFKNCADVSIYNADNIWREPGRSA
ncbi:uncharacterized protein LOC108602983 [Drosophila busckii]|uniref:uncharacterized protein LOC108602983 n=1 Tax=Drosophila busckii TaxID=30019 RepID=UPI00083F0B8B|nr:uncharacterized protein LOC108602983 [Drosophila busckii]